MDGALQQHAEALFGPGVDVRFSVGAQRELPSDGGEPAESAHHSTQATTGLAVGAAAEDKRRPLTSREYSYLWSHVGKIENFWETLTEIEPGGVARFSELARTRGWEVLFVTQRPPSAGDLAQRQSMRWLAANGYDLPSAIVMNGSRGTLANTLRLDAFIDDRGENCIDIATESRTLPLLLWRGPKELAPPGASRMKIHTVFSFAEALDCLEALSEVRSTPPSLMSRLKNAIRP